MRQGALQWSMHAAALLAGHVPIGVLLCCACRLLHGAQFGEWSVTLTARTRDYQGQPRQRISVFRVSEQGEGLSAAAPAADWTRWGGCGQRAAPHCGGVRPTELEEGLNSSAFHAQGQAQNQPATHALTQLCVRALLCCCCAAEAHGLCGGGPQAAAAHPAADGGGVRDACGRLH